MLDFCLSLELDNTISLSFVDIKRFKICLVYWKTFTNSLTTILSDIVANGSEWFRDAVLDASPLMKCMLSFEFIVTLHTIE